MTKFAATIFVEGDSDQKFIQDFVKHRFNCDLRIGKEIQDVNGKNSLHLFQTNFIQSTAQGLTNLVLFDANGSFAQSVQQLKVEKQRLNIEFDLFLFPNNKGEGDLETLLENIINQANKNIFECFDGFTKCLEKLDKGLKIPDRKTKIYSYTSLLNKEANPTKRDYLDQELWNLHSEFLDPLYQFLSPYISEV